MLKKLLVAGICCILCSRSYAQPKIIKNSFIDSALNSYQITQVDTLGKVFTVVSKPAEYRGGLAGWTSYLQKNLNGELGAKYIKLKKTDTTVRQTVSVSFIVDINGLVTDVTADKGGCHPKLIEEAIRVLKESPRWAPARIEYFENINGQIPIQKILDKSKSGFTRSIYRHKQNISFECTREIK